MKEIVIAILTFFAATAFVWAMFGTALYLRVWWAIEKAEEYGTPEPALRLEESLARALTPIAEWKRQPRRYRNDALLERVLQLKQKEVNDHARNSRTRL
jgi:hypothetical protein